MGNAFPKVLIIGYGSIGRKHAQILSKLKCNVVLFTKQKKVLFKTIKKKSEILEYDPDYIIISNNTNKHIQFLNFIEKNFKKKKVLIEKPISNRYKKIRLVNNKYVVGYNLRFHPIIQFIKKNIKKKEINFISVNVSSYLPRWRTNYSYEKSNSSKKKFGGGLLLDLSHELDYIKWLFGNIKIIYSFNKRISNLEINTDDVLILFGKINKKINVIFNMNFFSRIENREIIIEGKKYSIKANLIKNQLNVLTDRSIKKYSWKNFNIFKTYVHEHKKILKNDFKDFCDIKDSMETLKLIEKIRD